MRFTPPWISVAERPEEDRRESSRKAAATRAQNMASLVRLVSLATRCGGLGVRAACSAATSPCALYSRSPYDRHCSSAAVRPTAVQHLTPTLPLTHLHSRDCSSSPGWLRHACHALETPPPRFALCNTVLQVSPGMPAIPSKLPHLVCLLFFDQVGPGMPAQAGQPQSYDAELRGGSWAVQREVSLTPLSSAASTGCKSWLSHAVILSWTELRYRRGRRAQVALLPARGLLLSWGGVWGRTHTPAPPPHPPLEQGDVGALRAQVAEGDRQAAEIEQYKVGGRGARGSHALGVLKDCR